MKCFLMDNVQIDSFSDGECVVYDGNNEIMHVLNQTASLILKALLENGEHALQIYLQNAEKFGWNITQTELENDFKSVFESLLESNIIVFR